MNDKERIREMEKILDVDKDNIVKTLKRFKQEIEEMENQM